MRARASAASPCAASDRGKDVDRGRRACRRVRVRLQRSRRRRCRRVAGSFPRVRARVRRGRRRRGRAAPRSGRRRVGGDARDAEQQMVVAEIAVAQHPRLVLGELDDAAGFVVKLGRVRSRLASPWRVDAATIVCLFTDPDRRDLPRLECSRRRDGGCYSRSSLRGRRRSSALLPIRSSKDGDLEHIAPQHRT